MQTSGDRGGLLFAASVLVAAAILQVQCTSVPHLIWPQKDIERGEQSRPTSDKRVLVASRSSHFKDAVVAKVGEALKEEAVYVKFIGLDRLDRENAGEYDAVVMINTCMAWRMDRNVDAFLKRHQDHANMIVLTTSGDGGWLPDKEGRYFDAISSASEQAKVDEVASEIVARVQALLQNKEGQQE